MESQECNPSVESLSDMCGFSVLPRGFRADEEQTCRNGEDESSHH